MTDDLFEVWKDGRTYAMTPTTLIDELTYSNYAYNRRLSPQVSVEQWRKLFGAHTDAMEARFQAETTHPATDSPV